MKNNKKSLKIVGPIIELKELKTAAGQYLGLGLIDSESGKYDFILFPKAHTKLWNKLCVGKKYALSGHTNIEEDPQKLYVDEVLLIE